MTDCDNPVPGICPAMDVLLAADIRRLDGARVEMAAAAFSVGCLCSSALGGAIDREPVRRDTEQVLTGAVWDLMRVAAAIGLDLDTAIAAEIARRNADRARLAAQGAPQSAGVERALDHRSSFGG